MVSASIVKSFPETVTYKNVKNWGMRGEKMLSCPVFSLMFFIFAIIRGMTAFFYPSCPVFSLMSIIFAIPRGMTAFFTLSCPPVPTQFQKYACPALQQLLLLTQPPHLCIPIFQNLLTIRMCLSQQVKTLILQAGTNSELLTIVSYNLK